MTAAVAGVDDGYRENGFADAEFSGQSAGDSGGDEQVRLVGNDCGLCGAARGFGADTGADSDGVIALVKNKFVGFVSHGGCRPMFDKRAKLAVECGDDGEFFQVQ